MKITGCVFLFVITFGIGLIFAAESPSRKTEPASTSRVEERMRDEKRRDEQAARAHAANVKVARFDSVWRVPREEDIDVFPSGEPLPNRDRKIIALMSFECEIHEETHAVAGLIVKAKDLGAEAVHLLPTEPVISAQTLTTAPTPRDRRVFRANAIVYK
jgi:hypothetical protein